ncbi:MAG: hypothetical protein PHH59_05380 [Methylovulum sp.]|uniref:hypothetical protein n=1 Tax=Methylovulum sp. TaxID=1916980 RepID=UPI002635B56B|nr:hypothetical protein [Methylovulum sp.]MDD2723444.1 hypothetical protein [Methylovulum sp.]MDD5124081.1 hypothetical protein [Methylovulum sp.]
MPASNVPRIINSIEELKNELQNNRQGLRQTAVTVEQAIANETGTGDGGNVLGNKSNQFDVQPDNDGQSDGLLPGFVGSTKSNGGKPKGDANAEIHRNAKRTNATVGVDAPVENKYR